MIRRPPRSTHCISSAASDVYKRQEGHKSHNCHVGNTRAECFNERLLDERSLCLLVSCSVSQQVVVLLLFPLQSTIESIQTNYVDRQHITHQYTKDWDEVLGVENVIQLKNKTQKIGSDYNN
eukprot:TRINITY_DN3954_c0_g1_i2.p3 TRINITY_DN3954_c0_g1~~TRINITY_DN3954_c0_g1_i2.p3  ORF type:complete len:122 (+),score=15.41 TRINITY_DN3954_c0_g1_i2:132-497(+)